MQTCLIWRDASSVPTIFVILLAISIALCVLVFMIVMVWVWCKLFSKAGYCWALGLLMLVPIANIIMPFVLAFGDWPILKELRRLRQQLKTAS